MSPFVAYHSTHCCHRDGIIEYGLLPNLPNASQLFGVYVYRNDYWHRTRHMKIKGAYRPVHCIWTHGPDNDLWEIAYIGPMCPDQFVENGLVLFDSPQFVSLVSLLS